MRRRSIYAVNFALQFFRVGYCSAAAREFRIFGTWARTRVQRHAGVYCPVALFFRQNGFKSSFQLVRGFDVMFFFCVGKFCIFTLRPEFHDAVSHSVLFCIICKVRVVSRKQRNIKAVGNIRKAGIKLSFGFFSVILHFRKNIIPAEYHLKAFQQESNHLFLSVLEQPTYKSIQTSGGDNNITVSFFIGRKEFFKVSYFYIYGFIF